MSHFTRINVWSCRNTFLPRHMAWAVTFINFLLIQTLITANWDTAQKNCFHFHNPAFMLNPILQTTHTGGRVPWKVGTWARPISPTCAILVPSKGFRVRHWPLIRKGPDISGSESVIRRSDRYRIIDHGNWLTNPTSRAPLLLLLVLHYTPAINTPPRKEKPKLDDVVYLGRAVQQPLSVLFNDIK